MKKVYIIYSKRGGIGYRVYENETVAKEIARLMTEQMNEEWKVKTMILTPNPF